MSSRRLLILAALLAASCGSRVIGDLGDSQDGAGSGGAGGGGATGGGGLSQPMNTAGSLASSGGTGGGGAGVTTAGSPQQSTAGASSAGSGGGDVPSMGGAGPDGVAGGGGGGEGGDGGEPNLPPPLTVAPILHLKLDDCDGPVIDTQSPTTGVRAEVDCVDGVLGKAAYFSPTPGANGPRQIDFADEPRFQFSHALTVAAWVKPEAGAPTTIQAIADKWYYYDVFELAVRWVDDGKGGLSPRFSFTVAEPEGEVGRPTDLLSPNEVDLEQWSHVAGVYEWSPTVGRATLYVNGEAVKTATTKVGAPGLQQSAKPFRVGYAEAGSQFVGRIDEVRLYDVALGPEVRWLFLDPAHP